MLYRKTTPLTAAYGSLEPPKIINFKSTAPRVFHSLIGLSRRAILHTVIWATHYGYNAAGQSNNTMRRVDPTWNGRIKTFPARTTLLPHELPSDCALLLVSGSVKLTRGSRTVLDYLRPGDFFGVECLNSGLQEHVVATTLSLVEVVIVRKSRLNRLLRSDARLTRQLLMSLITRMDRYERVIESLVTENADCRLARLLIDLAYTETSSEWIQLKCSPSNSDLAKSVGTTRWRIAHFMRKFQNQGWLERRPELWIRAHAAREFLRSARNRAKVPKSRAPTAGS